MIGAVLARVRMPVRKVMLDYPRRRRLLSGLLIAGVVVARAPLAYAAHVDPAPLPDSVVERLTRSHDPQAPTSAAVITLRQHLDELSDIAHRSDTAQAAGRKMAGTVASPEAQRMQFAGKRGELEVVHQQLRAEFAQTRS